MKKPPGDGNSKKGNGNSKPPAKPPKMPKPFLESTRTVASQNELKTGKGTYEVTKRMGNGSVYKAVNRETGETVTIKFIPKGCLRSMEDDKEAVMRRFEREAQLVVRLKHPNIIDTIDFGFYNDTPFIVMEYFPGESLYDIIRKVVDENGRSTMTWEWVGPVIMAACDGLHAAHVQQIMHRDVKLGNIMVMMQPGEGILRPVERVLIEDESGKSNEFLKVKVLDFGLAKHVYHQGTKEDLTREGLLAGTPDYMAPEQVSKAQQGTAAYDYRVDIYSLGVVMYKALTGQPPFQDGIEGLMERLDKMPTPPRSLNPDITPEVEAIILKAMATKPEDRYQSAMELKAAIADTL